MSTNLKTLMALLNELYPPELASEWDSIGIIHGKKSQKISGILLCVDITPETFAEALERGCDAIVSHHPLYLEDEYEFEYKARIINEAREKEMALINCHTNADAMNPGVSDALAEVLGIKHLKVLDPLSNNRFGIGRIGDSAHMSYAEFVAHVQRAIPNSVVRWSAEVAPVIKRVALCAGSGASLLSSVRATDADVYVTSDLKHHAVSEHLAEGGCALIDIDHGVSESLYLTGLKRSLEEVLDADIFVSKLPFSTWVAQ